MKKIETITPTERHKFRGIIKYDFELTEENENRLWGEAEMLDDDPLTSVAFINRTGKKTKSVFFRYSEWNRIAEKHNERLLKKWVLDDAERRYLRNVTRPFKDDIRCIVKYESCSFVVNPYEYLIVKMGVFDMEFPPFPKGTMYQGMEKCKEYTLEELGL